MHIGYAVVVGTTLLSARRRLVRMLGMLYPPSVLLVVVATGNHFFFDAATGVGVAAIGFGAAVLLVNEPRVLAPAALPLRGRAPSPSPSSS
jgi:hypothetical protein